jgi:hypothetical protein
VKEICHNLLATKSREECMSRKRFGAENIIWVPPPVWTPCLNRPPREFENWWIYLNDYAIAAKFGFIADIRTLRIGVISEGASD